MNGPSLFGLTEDRSSLQVLWEENGTLFCRTWRHDAEGNRNSIIVALVAAEHPMPDGIERLAHEYGLREHLEAGWAIRPLEFVQGQGRTILMFEDPGGELLSQRLGKPVEVESFLRCAIAIVRSVGKMHQRGLVHKNIKPAHIMLNCADGAVRLTGFGIASRLPRERPASEPPEFITGTPAYMAPEQTGRMNRSIDSRSDLYALGVVFFELLTGRPPFEAADTIEWIHCHIARRPGSPADLAPEVPQAISAIVMKLLSKPAEDRYQTAAGLEQDLLRCLAEWSTMHRIDSFRLGERDVPNLLLVPERLYGRDHNVATLLACLDDVLTTGTVGLVLVSGYSGIGKSALVNELHKVLVGARGLFASGKFDQYKRDIPYATLAQAFQGRIRQLLGKTEADLSKWRGALVEALGPNALLIVDLIPELKFIIGQQPAVPELAPHEAKARFQLVLRRFISVFARPDHPLVLFLDDLQWLDAATLDFVEDLLTQPDVRHLLVIGAYRNNEVTAAHPLTRTLDAIRRNGGRIQEITLAPLAHGHVNQLITDALRCEPERAAPLAQLVHEKTAGNPFFVIEFLYALTESGLLTFGHDDARWSWDLDRIQAEGYTDNVVDLLVWKLKRLPVETQKALQQLAALGNVVDVPTLSTVLGISKEQVRADLLEGLRQGLIIPLPSAYKFAHDRVQEAGYSLIPEAERAETHLRIGRSLAVRTAPEARDETVFDIVNHLNRGVDLITSMEEREQLAELNLLAGQRAKSSTAYASALNYLTVGAALLPGGCPEHRHKLLFALELNLAECEFLTGASAAAEERLAALATWAATTVERASVACLRIDLYIMLGQTDAAAAVGLDYLGHLGIKWSPHPTAEEAWLEYQKIGTRLGDRPIAELIDLPLMQDPPSLATLDVLAKLSVPALYTDPQLLSLIGAHAVNLSLEGGNCDGSCLAYAVVGFLAGPRFGDYQTGFRFGRLSYDLVEQRGLRRFQARIYFNFGSFVTPWVKHVREGRDLLRRASETANRTGDLNFEAYCSAYLNTNLLAAGDPLGEVQAEVEHGLAFARKMPFALAVDRMRTQLGLIRTLRGLTPTFGSFDGDGFEEHRFEEHLAGNPAFALAEGWYWIRKLQARFLAGDHACALEASERAQRFLWASPSMFETAEYHFYRALALAASCNTQDPDSCRSRLDAITPHHEQLKVWAENCPENFANRAALVGAEIARIAGRELDAERMYEHAIVSARANGLVHNEAIANEIAARFHASRGLETIAKAYLREARVCYLSWGAEGKVGQLDALHPFLSGSGSANSSAATIAAPVEHLDFATVVKMSQAVSGEMVLERLVDTLMRLAIEHAGAQRGVLLLSRGGDLRQEAEAVIDQNTIVVRRPDGPAVPLPDSVVQYVMRTREILILNDASTHPTHFADSYIREVHARSILCLPLVNDSKVTGVLYLENNLTPYAFTSVRMAVLKLLALQAAISLENTHLYGDLAEREAKIRRLFEANIIGIFIWDLRGNIVDSNDAFLDLVGYDRNDLANGALRWLEITPVEYREAAERRVADMLETGIAASYEKEFWKKDGSRVPVLVVCAIFDGAKDQGVAFVLDLTHRRKAEKAARETEKRYQELQLELAHATRVATIGQLTASVAHEVNQPLSGIVTNASTCLRMLAADPPNLDGARETVRRTIRDGNRASDIIVRLRALFNRKPPAVSPVDLNDATRDVIALSLNRLRLEDVHLQVDLVDDLPLVIGDRVQLQQVIINLLNNAVDAMSPVDDRQRQLLIRTEREEGGGVRLTLQDSGQGFGPEDTARLFDAFYTTKGDGMGIGLSVSRSIIESHRGRLWAAPNDGPGATFAFSIPGMSEDAACACEPNGERASSGEALKRNM
ncbi:trifunctional serine/threonine-protein kinase/ATP-binding protein/sensor histidine kinase [Bradyrhizobium elkanii]|uniref:trifunctional serine/threonine-protein kinase/ATP-binding protein/sensor histidine kinase n=1 Tax=Bradyrhizobium elkanii TaxID=29448 RepID=UPI001BA84B69|nr:AAA family ATPase [Bradyrhizobium elkanii]MBR1159682.1 AAA family ATPase [Bradyrhizobium elkanii]